MTMTPNSQDIRRFVDGELSSEQADQFKQRLENDPELRRNVEFEQRLREHVITVMARSDATAPAELAERIRAELQLAESVPDTTDSPDVVGRIATSPRPSIFDGPTKANFFAVAASLALVAGAVLFGIFGPRIDGNRTGPSLEETISDAAAFVSNEHTRCVGNDDALQQKLIFPDWIQARSTLARHLGVSRIPDFDLSSLGYTFVGGGPCGVPNTRASGHFMFRRAASLDDAIPMVSIFMVPDADRFELDDLLDSAQQEWEDCTGGSGSVRRVLRSSNGQITFYICCCMDEDLEQIARLIDDQMTTP